MASSLLATDTEQKSARPASSTFASSSAASAASAAGNIVGFSYGGEKWKKDCSLPDFVLHQCMQKSMMYKSME
jgi:hypothetical protein